MASLFRAGVCKIFNSNSGKLLLLCKKDGLIVRTITSNKSDRPMRPAPWPYQEKPYNILHYFFDKTTSRLDENSKILVVEGPIAAGKSKFAKELANELDMLYMPEANLDMYYINEYGFDIRSLDSQLPETCRSFDINNFLRNPKHRLTARFQIQQYIMKYSQYIDALAHVLSTGQGVVLDRCVYSDFVFTEAMYSQGYLSKLAKHLYYDVRSNSLQELLRPHLVIYLDVPVNKVLANIKKRAISYEKDSPVLTPQYLEVMERKYKQNYLKDISQHAELLVYDWSEEGEVEIVVEDIERIDFNKYDEQEPQLKDWVYRLEEEWAVLRYKYSDQKDFLMTYPNVPGYEVSELVVEAEDAEKYHQIINNAPGQEYQKGYNATLGDQGLLFKMAVPHRNTLPLRERRQFT